MPVKCGSYRDPILADVGTVVGFPENCIVCTLQERSGQLLPPFSFFRNLLSLAQKLLSSIQEHTIPKLNQ